MAAFCGCCGAEITGKPEACPVCGTPRHGMFKADREVTLDLEGDRFQALIEEPQASTTPVPPSAGRHRCHSSRGTVGDSEMEP